MKHNQNETITWREVVEPDGTIHMVPPNGGHVASMSCPCKPLRGHLPGTSDNVAYVSHYDGPLMLRRLITEVQAYMSATGPMEGSSAYWGARSALDAIRAVYRKSDSNPPPYCPECHEERRDEEP